MSQPQSDPLKVLVLDDDDVSRDLSRKIFAFERADVVLAATAVEAEREIRGRPEIDVVSLDVSLRGGGHDRDGADLARRLRASRPDLPIIGYSSYFSESALTEEERAAFTGYFARAGTTQDIAKWVDRCLTEAVRYREARREELYQQLVRASDRAARSTRTEPTTEPDAGTACLGPDLARLLDATSTAAAKDYLAKSGSPLEQSAAVGLQAFSESIDPVLAEEALALPAAPSLDTLAVGLVYLEHRLDQLGRDVDAPSSRGKWRRHLDDSTKVAGVVAGVVAAAVGIVKLLGG